MLSNPGLKAPIGGLRNIVFVAGLAVPPIIGLAAVGLAHLIKVPWPRFRIPDGESNSNLFTLDTRWLLAIPAIGAVMSACDFSGSRQPGSIQVSCVVSML